MGLTVDTTPVCSPTLELLGVFSGPCTGHQNVDPKQIDCQIFLPQRWVNLGSAENCNLGSATMVSHREVPKQQGKENSYKEEKEVGRAIVNRAHGFPLAELLPRKKSLFFLLSSAIAQGMSAPPSGLPTLCN